MDELLINLIENKDLNDNTLVLLFVYIYNNNIKTTNQLITSLLNSYTEQSKDNGYLYCIHNEIYKHYGENVYKLGCAKNVRKRLNGYTTYYLEPSEIKHESNIIKCNFIAESILFSKLQQYRIKANREFFNCNLEIIKKTIDEVEQEIKDNSIINLIGKYNLNINKLYIFNEFSKDIVIKYKNQFSKILIDDTAKIEIKKQPITNKSKYLEIFKADDITKLQFNELSKHKLDDMTLEQKIKLEKYIMTYSYNTAKREEKYGYNVPKQEEIFNIKYIKDNYANINKTITSHFLIGNCNILRNNKEWYDKKNMIIEVILGLGFILPNVGWESPEL